LETAVAFLEPIAQQSPNEFDSYALRWFRRWLSETPRLTAEKAADIAATLAELPEEPVTSTEALRRAARV
jgi:hypothetical protein